MQLKCFILLSMLTTAVAASAEAQAGPLGDRLRERFQGRAAVDVDEEDAGSPGVRGAGDPEILTGNGLTCAEWAQKANRIQARAAARNPGPTPSIRDVPYGSGNRERLDVYLPNNRRSNGTAPIIMMVHGGGWCVGDKADATVTTNKVTRWVPRGFLFVSINYPMINDGSNALAQASYVARAAAFVQTHAKEWGGDSTRLILMGHSSGAHLVSLVNADSQIRQANGLNPILGAVSLDAGAIDIVRQMPNVYPFLQVRYREAFGTAQREWIAASPYHRLDRSAAPWLGVCSTTRKDDSCGQARAYMDKSIGIGRKASVLPEQMRHGDINRQLGLPNEYTKTVEEFLASLDSVVAGLLK